MSERKAHAVAEQYLRVVERFSNWCALHRKPFKLEAAKAMKKHMNQIRVSPPKDRAGFGKDPTHGSGSAKDGR